MRAVNRQPWFPRVGPVEMAIGKTYLKTTYLLLPPAPLLRLVLLLLLLRQRLLLALNRTPFNLK